MKKCEKCGYYKKYKCQDTDGVWTCGKCSLNVFFTPFCLKFEEKNKKNKEK